jgi:hypothetical protein
MRFWAPPLAALLELHGREAVGLDWSRASTSSTCRELNALHGTGLLTGRGEAMDVA